MSPYQISDDGMLRPIYRPLICTIAYGRDVYFECLRSFLESLAEFGAYESEITIFSDRTMEQLSEYVPALWRGKVAAKPLTASDHSARYGIGELDIAGYCPVLYLDNDVV